MAEESVGFFGEPAGVAELEGELEGVVAQGRRGEEIGEAGMIGDEVGRELEEQWAELAGATRGFERGDELSYGVMAIAQALEVGDSLLGLEAETKAGGCGVEPALQLSGSGEGAEGVVDLNRGEARSVDVEEGAGRNVGRVEAGLPGGIGPAGGSGEQITGRRRERRGGYGDEFRSSRQTRSPRRS